MKTINKAWAVIAMVPMMSFAQAQDVLNVELNKLYEGQKVDASAPAAVTEVAPAGGTAQIQNVQQNVQFSVQKQPVVVIEDTPLVDSRAERLRKSRQEAELLTEQTIVEKLEQSRLEDEKRRAEALFGKKLETQVAPEVVGAPVKAAPVSPLPVVVVPQATAEGVAPVAAAATGEPSLTKDDIRGEVKAALAELKTQDAPNEPKEESYISGTLGLGEYPDAINVRGNYSAGFAVGKVVDEKLVFEGSFLYGNYDIEQIFGGFYDQFTGEYYPRITEMDQYNVAMNVKYNIFRGRLTPVVGAAVGYTYRSYTDTQFAVTDERFTSHALDAGLIAGADLRLTNSFSIGMEYKHMWNITNRQNSGLRRSFQDNNGGVYGLKSVAVEDLNHYNVGIFGRATF
jgi:hypothetical protein